MKVVVITDAYQGAHLVEATHVILLDPPKDIKTTEAVERATIASAYRLGQTKQISVVRFIFKDTIMDEEFVQKILSDDKKMKRRLVEINNREK
jgi:SNF2 family DNA or RNA helicase